MAQVAFYEELMHEISEQTLAKLGCNIFKGDSFAAAAARAASASALRQSIQTHANNPMSFGHNYEQQCIGELNAQFAQDGSGYEAISTDAVAHIVRSERAMMELGRLKNSENLSAQEQKHRAKLEKLVEKRNEYLHIYSPEQMRKMAQNERLAEFKFNDTQSDLVVLSASGEVLDALQLKASTASVWDEQFAKYEKFMVDESTYARWSEEFRVLSEQINSADFAKKPPKVQQKLLAKHASAKKILGGDGEPAKVISAGHKITAGYTSLTAARVKNCEISEQNLKLLSKANAVKISKKERTIMLANCEKILKNSQDESELKRAKEIKQILNNHTKSAVLVADEIITLENEPINEATLEKIKTQQKNLVLSKQAHKNYNQKCEKKITELEAKLRTASGEKAAKIKQELKFFKDFRNAINCKTNNAEAMKNARAAELKEYGAHAAKTAASDAAISALEALVRELVRQMQEEFLHGQHEDLSKRFTRICAASMSALASSGARGAGFAALDALTLIIAQFCSKIGGHLRYIWQKLRGACKSVFNAVYDYISGKITSLSEVVKIALKSLFAAVMAGFGAVLDAKLCELLTPALGPLANMAAAVLSIAVCAACVVAFSRALDMAIGAFVSVYAAADAARARREEVQSAYAQIMPQMLSNHEALKAYAAGVCEQLASAREAGMASLREALARRDFAQANEALKRLADEFGAGGLFASQAEFDGFMSSSCALEL